MRKARAWLRSLRPENWEGWVLACLAALNLILGLSLLKGWTHFYPGDENESANRYFLLSAIGATLAPILAVAVTAILVVTQLAADTFTPRVINYRLRDPWLWGVLVIYVLAILVSLAGVAESRALRTHAQLDRLTVDLAILLSFDALIYLLPFTAAALRGLDRDSFISRLLLNKEYEGLQDLMRKAINEGLFQQLKAATGMLGGHARRNLALKGGSVELARLLSRLGVDLGRYACKQGDSEAIVLAFGYLTEMTTFCTQMVFRGAADVFNESVIELQVFAQEAFGR